MKYCFLILCITYFTIDLYSQDNSITRNNVYLEIGGASFIYSINYDRLLSSNPDKNISTRIGFTYLNSFGSKSKEIIGIPVGLSYLKRIGKRFFETGISGSVNFYSYDISGANYEHIQDLVLIPSLRAGIRNQPKTKGIFWNLLLQFSVVVQGDKREFKNPDIRAYPFLSFGIGYSL